MVKSVKTKVAQKEQTVPISCYLERYHLFLDRAKK
jgi:hypothetical protein